jgi:hypothetical protein
VNTPDEQDRFLNEGRFRASEARIGAGWIVLLIVVMILPLPGGFLPWLATCIWIGLLVGAACLLRINRKRR